MSLSKVETNEKYHRIWKQKTAILKNQKFDKTLLLLVTIFDMYYYIASISFIIK